MKKKIGVNRRAAEIWSSRKIRHMANAISGLSTVRTGAKTKFLMTV
jgi:hypothetical protein